MRADRRRAPPRLPSPSAPPRTIAAILALFALAFTGLAVNSYSRVSATWDEPTHLAAGYLALARGDFRLDMSHPPLLRMWAALPLLALDPKEPDTPIVDRDRPDTWYNGGAGFARRFLFSDNDADRMLSAARFMVVLLGVGLGISMFFWTYETLGLRAALLALAFYAMEPNLLAHVRLVTTDFGAAAFMFTAVYLLWRVVHRPSFGRVAALSACVACAVLTKFSAVLLAPTILLLLAAGVAAGKLTTRRAASIVVAITVTAFVATWAIYGFRQAPGPDGSWSPRIQESAFAPRATGLAAGIRVVDELGVLPAAFTQGFLFNQVSLAGWPAFLLGEYSFGGWWYYFPAAFLLKTPLPLVVLFAAGAVLALRRPQVPLLIPFLAVPVTVYMAAAMTSGVNMGVRHILPVYPFVLVIAAAAAARLASAPARVPRAALAALMVAWVAESALAYPRPLTFFNTLAGGPENGFRHLADSNLAWGGNLKALKAWMESRRIDRINLAYFGSADPAYYGITPTYLPGSPTFTLDLIARPQLPGYVAISGTVLNGVYLEPRWRLFYKAFWDREPVAVIGNSMRVYWVEDWPEPPPEGADLATHVSLADALLLGMRWPEHAARHYEVYLRTRPHDPAVLTRMGIALAESGRTADSIATLTRVTELAPHDANARRNLEEVRRRALLTETASP